MVLFSEHVSSFFPLSLLGVVWVVYLSGLSFLHFSSYNLSSKVNWQWRHLFVSVTSFLLAFLVLLFAGRCFNLTYIPKDINGQEKSFVVIDRQLDRPVARLSQDDEDTFMRWEGGTINPLHFDVAPGLRMEGEFNIKFRMNEVLPDEQNLILDCLVKYNLDVNDDIEFHVALDKWARTDVLQSSIDLYLAGLAYDVEKDLKRSRALHNPMLFSFDRNALVKNLFMKHIQDKPISPEVKIQLE